MIGLCIKYFHENYGGMLQAFATTKYLEKQGCKYEIIRYEREKNLLFKLKSIPRLFNSVLLNDKMEELKKKIGLKKNKEFYSNYKIRMSAFKKFREEKFQKLSPIATNYKELCNLSNRYSLVISGSDQLWSPAGLPTKFYNLLFVAENVKKASYASSFGVKNIPWYQKKRIRGYLNRIESISVRENRGREIIKELTNRDVEVVVDPVFLLSKKDWDNFLPPKRIIKEKYVFAYFLGENEEYRLAVEKYAKINNYKIVTLRHLDKYVESDEKFGDYCPYDLTPEDFLNLIRFSEYVFTDSYHGTLFSIINQKEFIIFDRYSNTSKVSKNSRIDSLCENLNLSNRRYKNEPNFITQAKNKINYKEVDILKTKLIEKSEAYLKGILEGNDNND